MSFRKNQLDLIRSGEKRLEYRKRFNPAFGGIVYAYESGKGAAHKVVASFHTEQAAFYDIEATEDTQEVTKCLAKTSYTNYDQECLIDLSCSVWIIPIIDFKQEKPLSLEEFSKIHGVTPTIIKPPMSWQFINTKGV